MAHTKAGGSTSLGRESQSKRLGIKRGQGEYVLSGSILARQRGTKYHPGDNVVRSGDDSLFAKTSGYVHFAKKKQRAFHGGMRMRTFIHVKTDRPVVRKK